MTTPGSPTTRRRSLVVAALALLLSSCGDDDRPPPSPSAPAWCLVDAYRVQDLLRFRVRGECDAGDASTGDGSVLLNYEVDSEDVVVVIVNASVACPRVSTSGVVVLPALGPHAMHAALVLADGGVLECAYEVAAPPGMP